MATASQLKDFFGTPERPVSAAEYMEFYKSCSPEFKEELKNFEISAA